MKFVVKEKLQKWFKMLGSAMLGLAENGTSCWVVLEQIHQLDQATGSIKWIHLPKSLCKAMYSVHLDVGLTLSSEDE